MIKKYIVPALLVFLVATFFSPMLFHGKLPIPADTIIGLYHPYRDFYAKEYPNGIPYKNFLITDPVRQQYPWRTLALQIEKKGHLPLWDPYSFAGTPLLANFQTAAFYPFNIFLFVLPFYLGWSFLILIGQLLAGIFMYWYLSHLRLNYYARFVGSIVYMFCGFMIAWLEWGTLTQTAIWLPLLLLGLDKIFETYQFNKSNLKKYKENIPVKNQQYIWPIIFVLSLTFAFFAGHLQPFFYLLIVTISYFFARWFQYGKPAKLLLLIILTVFVFLLFTAIQWVPTIQFIFQSARDVDQLNGLQQPGWFIPWQNIIQFVAPDFFGNPATLNYWGIWNYGEFIGYIGIFPLFMALFAMLYRYDKKTLFFGTLFFLSILFSFQTIFAKIPYLLHLPFLSTSQPTRLLFITDFSLAILAALGLDLFMHIKSKRKIIFPSLFLVISFIVLWSFVLFGNKILHFSSDYLQTAKHNLYFPTILLFISISLSLGNVIIKNVKARNVCIIILLVVTVIDLFRFADKFIPFVSRAYLFPTTPALAYLQQQKGQFRIMSTDSEILPPNFSVMYHLQSLDGYDPLYLQRYGELIAAVGRNKPDIHSPFGFNRIITPNNINSRLIDLFGVQYVMSLSDIHEGKLVKVYTEGQTQIYKNTSAFPRIFFITNIRIAKDKFEAINLLFDKNINLHSTAIVEGWDNSHKYFINGSAKITNYRENSVSITAQNKDNSFLVVTDTYYPTWHVTIDGKEGKIYRTDYNFRGIILPKGNHHVVFYDSLL